MTMRLLIVGTGSMAEMHAQAFTAIDGIEIVGTVETNAGRREAFAEKHGITNVFTELDEAIAWGEFDAATNVTPDLVHYPTTMKLIAAGKHVLCEKPLATAYAQAKEMADAADAADVINMVNLTYRASPALQHARALVQSGEIGALRHFEAEYLQSWLVAKHWGDWRTEDRFLWRLSTGHGSKGTVGDIGIHIVDFATYAAASDIVSLTSRVKTFHKAEGDSIGEYVLDANDSFVMIAELDNGAIGTVQATRFAAGNANELRVQLFGTAGALRVHTDGRKSSLFMCSGAGMDKQTWREIDCRPTQTTYERFAAALATGVNGDPDFRRAAKLQQVLDLCLAEGSPLVTVG